MIEGVIIRDLQADDTTACGRLIFEGFKDIADRHGFERDFPSAEVAASFVGWLLQTPTVIGVVAEIHGKRVGCNFIDLADPVAAVGPLAVDPTTQKRGVGRALMEAVMARAAAAGIENVRFAQSAYNNTSLALYTRLGFRVRQPLSVIQGPPIAEPLPDHEVALASEDDVPACSDLCKTVHGFSRDGDVRAAVADGAAMVVRNNGRIRGYTTGVGFGGHSVAEDDQALKALIAAAPAFAGLGFLLPTNNHAVLDWCLAKGLRIVMPMNLMTLGLYSSPSGAWMPSVLR